MRCAIHPEGVQYSNNDKKCHQLRHFMCTFNRKARKIFHLGSNASFDEGGVPVHSRFCPVMQYNKDKHDKFRVDFFILADTKHYFIYHLDCYQGKRKANIDIDPTIRRLPTTQKSVVTAILKSDIVNDPNSICTVGTCKGNRKGLDSDVLKMDNADRGGYLRLVDARVGMVIVQ
eukprot:5162241-Ditylum_brightwellii.AAC.1